jgi:predicted alpha/beta hydrolase family esterase
MSLKLTLDATVPHGAMQAMYLGRACELAYLPAVEGAAAFREQLGLQAELVSVSNTQVYVGQNDANIVLAFRGSESLATLDGFRDWLLTNARNFLILPEGQLGTDFAAAGVGARFHSGFMTALADVWAEMFARVDREFSRSERPVWVTGHSLGGAIALLCGWRLQQQFINVHQMCTFGAPMIGNDAAAAAFAREFPDKIFRYVDAGDIVPRLPTVSLFTNAYMHCQREIVVGQISAAALQEKIDALAQAAPGGEINEQVESSLWNELRQGMPSHMMGNYLARLEMS